MTPIEKQVCSSSLSKRLKELGCHQESLFYWFDKQFGRENPVVEYCGYINGPMVDGKYSAFTCSELGEMLPYGYVTWKVSENMYRGKLMCNVPLNIQSKDGPDIWIETEADARVILLIYLLENNLINQPRGNE